MARLPSSMSTLCRNRSPASRCSSTAFTERLTIELGRLLSNRVQPLSMARSSGRSAALPRDRESFLKEGRGRAPISLAGKIFGPQQDRGEMRWLDIECLLQRPCFAVGIARFSRDSCFSKQVRRPASPLIFCAQAQAALPFHRRPHRELILIDFARNEGSTDGIRCYANRRSGSTNGEVSGASPSDISERSNR